MEPAMYKWGWTYVVGLLSHRRSGRENPVVPRERDPGLCTSGETHLHPSVSRARRELGMYFMFCVTKPWRASYFPTDVSGVV